MATQAQIQPEWDIFLAHAGADLQHAEQLYEHLQKKHWDVRPLKVFLDKRTLKLGDDWDIELATAQQRSRVTVVLISERTETAYYQREEIAAAIAMAREGKTKHRVVPVTVVGASSVNPAIPYGLRLKHGITVADGTGFERAAFELKDLIHQMDEVPESILVSRSLALETQSDPAPSLKQLADSAKIGGNAIRSFTSFVENAVTSGLRTIDIVKNRREKARLGKLMQELISIEWSQAPLPWLLRGYAQRHTSGRLSERFDNWNQVTSILAGLTPVVAEVVELLLSYQGDFMIVSPDTYKQILFGLKSRMRLYAEIQALKRPQSPEEFALLEEIAAEIRADDFGPEKRAEGAG
ncbi:MAG: toll/interleukin-1 receptor domain-containing protein [Acidobacteriota bacterium]|nr:toll/interleukin-1 receptor domain-containing protein [Acidobacteriota bacterium]